MINDGWQFILYFKEEGGSLSFDLVVMSQLKFGEFNYNNIVVFLFWLNDNFRDVLPGKGDEESLDDQTLKTIRNKIWHRIQGMKSDPL